MSQRQYYFSTRDLLMMAAVALRVRWQNGVMALGERTDGMVYSGYVHFAIKNLKEANTS